jgi:hypothetical protein
LQRANPKASLEVEEEEDIEDFELGVIRQAFNRESFRRLIARTFEDFYPGQYNTQRMNIDEYMMLVQNE